MTDKRIKSTPGGAGDTSCARPSSDKFRDNFDRIFGKPKPEKPVKTK